MRRDTSCSLETVICVNKENELGLKDIWTKSGI